MKTSIMNLPRQVDPQSLPSFALGGSVPLWKRALDIGLIVLSMPVVVPVGFAIAALIKIASPGPVLFKQERVGFQGRRFWCLKFRTMRVNADTGVHKDHLKDLIQSNRPMTKLDAKDPRLIKCGLILRSLGIDELPQLINVLRGDMSLVGPRPCIPYEYETYPARFRRRCETLPGLTGLWQVSGKNRLTFDEMVDLDLRYAEKKSLFLDLWIILKTIPALIVQVYDVKVRGKSASAPPPGQPKAANRPS